MSENAGKSGRQDSSLSARRARLRALAQQPGAYNNTAAAQEKPEESAPAPAQDKANDDSFEFYPKETDSQEDANESQAAPEPTPDPIIEETKINPVKSER